MLLTRRSFLGTAALGLTPVPRVLLAAASQALAGGDQPVLVVLQLSGGNDGLNTVVPFEDSTYGSLRPTLAISKGSALPLKLRGDAPATGGPGPLEVGFHPAMKGLHALYQEGAVAVVQGVGYPNPSRSHFRSMDIWHTARPGDEEASAGWLGTAVSRHRGALQALDVGDERLPLALQGETQVPTLQNLDWIDFLATERGRVARERLRSLNSVGRGAEAEKVRQLAASTLGDLESILAVRGKPCPVDYPESHVASSLKWVGQLVASGFGSRIYYLSQGGFDTHARQKDAHATLLGLVSDAVSAFYRHLKAVGVEKRVVLLVFSEFGRRVRENGSLGTDHGVAAPVFLVSGMVRGGLHGTHPALDDLDEGDLKHAVDFRRIYATLLDGVLQIPSGPILGGAFEGLDLLQRSRRV